MAESHMRSEKITKQANNEDTLTIIAVGTPEEIRSETDFDKASNVTEQIQKVRPLKKEDVDDGVWIG